MPNTHPRFSKPPLPAPIHLLNAEHERCAAPCGHPCAACAPMGEVQIIGVLLVAVFGLVSVLTAAVISLKAEREASAQVAPAVFISE